MRNLKRALSLALASMMLLGMMVIGAGAASVSDMDKVTNKDAVALMVDLGIIEGDNTGAFNPTGTINRAGVAKLAYYIQMGNADPGVYAGMGYFTDTAGHWAEGYINYCYAQGLLDGRGDGTFNPGGSLPVVGLAKVLLNTLGYDSELEGYVGTGWTINATRDAQSIGLLAGVTQGMNDIVTRDTAALMFYNALFLRTVEVQYQWDQGIRQPNGYKTSTTPLGYQVYGLVKQSAVVAGIDNNGNAILDTNNDGNADQVAGLIVSGKLSATPDMVGSTVTLYLKSSGAEFTNGVQTAIGAGSKLYNSTLVAGKSNVVATINGVANTAALGSTAADSDALLTALLITAKTKVASLESGADLDELKYYYNGTASTKADVDALVGKLGVVVEFKDTNATSGVDTVVVTEKQAKALTAAPVVSTVNGKTVVTIADLGVANKDTAKVVGYEGLTKGDVVLYLEIGGVTYIEKAAKITGSVTGNNTNKGAVIGGTYYQASELDGKTYANDSIKDTATYDFYLDNGGYIVAAVKVSDGTTITTNLAAVEQVGWVVKEGDGSIGSKDTAYMQAKLVFTDGTSQIVTVASVDGVVPVAANTAISTLTAATHKDSPDAETIASAVGQTALTSGTEVGAGLVAAEKYILVGNGANGTVTGRYFGVADADDLKWVSSSAEFGLVKLNNFYNYSVNSKGEYVLTSLNALTQGTNTAISGTNITNGKPNFAGSLVGNANTVFVYATTVDGKTTYTVYTGIANVPTTTGNVTGSAIVNGGVATYVFVNVKSTVSDSSDYVYIMSGDKTAVTGETGVYLYDVLLNGTATTLKISNNNCQAGELRAVESISDKDVYTLKSAESTLAGIKSVAGGVLVLKDGGAGEVFTYASGTPAYVIDGNTVTPTTVEALALDGNDEVAVINDGKGTALTVYVTKVSQAPTALTLTAGGSNAATVTNGDLTNLASVNITGLGKNVKVQTATAATGTTITGVSINGKSAGTYNGSWTWKDVALYSAAGANTVVVTVRDINSGATSSFSYTFNVAS